MSLTLPFENISLGLQSRFKLNSTILFQNFWIGFYNFMEKKSFNLNPEPIMWDDAVDEKYISKIIFINNRRLYQNNHTKSFCLSTFPQQMYRK